MSYFNHKLFDVLITNLPAQQSMQLQSFIESNDVLGLVNQEVDRSGIVTFEDVFIKELFRKVSDAPLGIDTAVVAVSGFMEVEKQNTVSNDAVLNLAEYIEMNPVAEISKFIGRTRRQITQILGDVPGHIEPNITIGATVDLKRNRSIFNTFVKPSVTFDCVQYLRKKGIVRIDYNSMFFPIGENPSSPFGAHVDDFIYYKGAKLETVPKTAKTDRVIAKEPTVNIAYQSGVGKVISERLFKFGLDIKTRAELHKVLAKIGSESGLLATIDLSAASDRIVRELVRLLLPNDWYELLDALRSKCIDINGQQHDLQMFSTAGNGFTFELETLLFYSIALSSTLKSGIYNSAPHDVSVFGDDIILPSCYYDNFATISKVVGFVINTRKSFKTGYFRESCGGDFYNGINVRGYNAKSLPSTPREWISFTNAVRRVCYYNNSNVWRSRWCSDLWHGLISHVPETERLFGPEHYGDTCINCEYTELYSIRYNKWRGETIKVHAPAGGEYTSVGREISDSRVSGHLAARLVCHESVLGKGTFVEEELLEDGDTVLNYKYPYNLLTSTVGIYYCNKWIPYSMYGQAPEDLDELAEHIHANFPDFGTPRQVVARKLIEKREVLSHLMELLRLISLKEAERVRIVVDTYESISFDF